mmetsp:Transcript_15893/g.20795  ORF Transcript_15893/g.20795 Transcript_15893/m.20795 type:complete len:106 (-) Transcript_15893:1112-1429(-)
MLYYITNGHKRHVMPGLDTCLLSTWLLHCPLSDDMVICPLQELSYVVEVDDDEEVRLLRKEFNPFARSMFFAPSSSITQNMNPRISQPCLSLSSLYATPTSAASM